MWGICGLIMTTYYYDSGIKNLAHQLVYAQLSNPRVSISEDQLLEAGMPLVGIVIIADCTGRQG